MKAPAFTLRVHTYEENRQDGTRTLVEYRPFLRLGAPAASGHSGEVVYLQHGYVYGEGGDPYAVEDLPEWFAAALAALTPQARHDVGFTPERVQWYTDARPHDNDVSASHRETWEVSPVALPTSPHWILGWLCKQRHDYQGTGMSRYGKDMRCVDCKQASRKPAQAKRTRDHARATSAALDGAAD